MRHSVLCIQSDRDGSTRAEKLQEGDTKTSREALCAASRSNQQDLPSLCVTEMMPVVKSCSSDTYLPCSASASASSTSRSLNGMEVARFSPNHGMHDGRRLSTWLCGVVTAGDSADSSPAAWASQCMSRVNPSQCKNPAEAGVSFYVLGIAKVRH